MDLATPTNLTIPAFVFIPVSTVFSIYGMSTAKTAQNNLHMWQFEVSACATTLVAIFAAWSYQYWLTFPHFLMSLMLVCCIPAKTGTYNYVKRPDRPYTTAL